MALIKPLTYMRTQLDSLGYSEWSDGFNFENIPSSIIDGAYHLEVGIISSQSANQRAHQFSFPVVLRVFLKGFSDPKSAIDDALLRGDNILGAVLSEANRLTQAEDIKDVVPNSITVQELSASNDNSVILQMEFVFNIYQCF